MIDGLIRPFFNILANKFRNPKIETEAMRGEKRAPKGTREGKIAVAGVATGTPSTATSGADDDQRNLVNSLAKVCAFSKHSPPSGRS